MMAYITKKGYILVISHLENSNTSSGANEKRECQCCTYIALHKHVSFDWLTDWLMFMGRQLAYFLLELSTFDWQVGWFYCLQYMTLGLQYIT